MNLQQGPETIQVPDKIPAATLPVLAAIPNLLSSARLLLALCFPWVPESWRLGVVLAAALSDLLDGVSSRTFHATSATGRILDPVADKAFVLSVLATLVVSDALAVWEILLVGARDLSVLVGVSALMVFKGWSAATRLRPSLLGKTTTAAQFAFLLTVLFYSELAALIFVPTVVLSVVAGADYLRRYFKDRDV